MLETTLLILIISLVAGFLGSITGLGGGVVIIPALALIFGVDLRYAIGASLVSVIATSSGAAAAYVKEGYTNIRIGMFLEIATTIGALLGAHITTRVSPSIIAIILGIVLTYSAAVSFKPKKTRNGQSQPDKIAGLLRMDSSFPTPEGVRHYRVQQIPGGFGMMIIAGGLSGLLGIGSGAFKVLAMDKIMRIPFKVSTTTSNFMIGVTAAASAGIYLNKGFIDPVLAMPVMIGVLAGSFAGTKVLAKAPANVLRMVFAVIILALAIEMIYRGMTGRL